VRTSTFSASGSPTVTRARISSAARRENVRASMRSGPTPRLATRCEILSTSTPVLPVPGPASTRRGPPGCSTALS
jgi:hypothetical protein